MSNEELKPEFLTVAQFIKDLALLPQDSEVVVAMLGGGLSIPIVGLASTQAAEGKTLSIISIGVGAAKNALLLLDADQKTISGEAN